MLTAVFFDSLTSSDASPRALSSFPSGPQYNENGSPAKTLRCLCNKWLIYLYMYFRSIPYRFSSCSEL